MEKVSISVEERIISEAGHILEGICMDVEMAVKVFLRRVMKDKSIAFLINTTATNKEDDSLNNKKEKSSTEKTIGLTTVNPVDNFTPDFSNLSGDEMSKSIALSMFRKEGLKIGKNITYASSKSSYYANPKYECLVENWWIILNDRKREIIYLLYVPAGELAASDLEGLKNSVEKATILIRYNDPTFTDLRSEISFEKYFVKSIQY